jgi:hypothetical protein
MTSLHKLAEEGNLPLHQNIDPETLEWIKKNKPDDLTNADYSEVANSIDVSKLTQLTPSNIWFTSENKINSLHGIRHLMRVAIYVYYLSKSIENAVKRNSLLLASLLHDIRRETDKTDEGHAKRGADWYQNKQDEIHTSLNIKEIDENIVIELIEQHEEMSDKNSSLLNILKTADALDRYVQPKMKWWINDEYLKLKPTIELKAFAFDLVTRSEEKYLNGIDSVSAVLDSLLEMKS